MVKNYSDEKLAIFAKSNPRKYTCYLYMRFRKYGYSIIDGILRKTYYYNTLSEFRDELLISAIKECVNDYNARKGSFRNLLSSVLAHRTFKLVSKFSKDALSDYVSIDECTLKGDMLFADSGCIGPMSPNKALDEYESKKIIMESYKPNNRKVKYIIELKNKGYSYKEIAIKLNKSKTAVRQLFYRIRKSIDNK